MFPAFLMPALLGGGLGLLTNKKRPLEDALLGAGLGAAGGAFLPGLLGGAATPAAGAPIMPTGGFLGEGVTSGVGAWDAAASPSVMGTLGKYTKPAMQVAQSGLLDGQEQQPIQPAQIQQSGGGQQVLASLAQGGGYQEELARSEEERRKRRSGLLGGVA